MSIKTVGDELIKANQIIKKCQGEIRNYHAKVLVDEIYQCREKGRVWQIYYSVGKGTMNEFIFTPYVCWQPHKFKLTHEREQSRSECKLESSWILVMQRL